MRDAKVEDEKKHLQHVRLYVRPLSESAGCEIRRRLSERAIYAAQLLSGYLPIELKEILEDLNVALVPWDSGRGGSLCSCPHTRGVCRHIVAVFCKSLDIFNRDPLLLLKVIGLDREELLSAILGRRGEQGSFSSTAEIAPAEQTGFSAKLSSIGQGGNINCAEHDDKSSCHAHGCDNKNRQSYVGDADSDGGDRQIQILSAKGEYESFYGGDELRDLLTELKETGKYNSDSTYPLGEPWFSFPLWRGDVSFKESLEPHYRSVRKLSI